MLSVLAYLGLRDARGLTPPDPGGATTSLLDSITRVVLFAGAVWQLVMVVVDAAAGLWELAAIQAAIGVIMLIAQRVPWLRPGIALMMVAAAAASYLLDGNIDSALTFAACWQINFASCFAGLLVLRRYMLWLVPAYATTVAVLLMIVYPSWGPQFPVSVIVTQTCIIVALRLGIAALLRHAATVDAGVADADEQRVRAEALSFQSTQLADEARTLHDTAINTFAAIAVARVDTRDADAVRAQCARDLTHIEELRGARPARNAATLLDVFAQPGLPTHRHGDDDARLEDVGSTLPPRVVAAIVGCVREAITNATKHSGAAYVDVSVVTGADLVTVEVRDDGMGFDVADTPTRGVEASILQRAADNGIDADIDSAPGAGTTVTLRVQLSSADDERGHDPVFVESAATVRRSAGMYWAFGATMVSVVLTLAGGTNVGGVLFPMIGLMFFAIGVAWLPALRGNPAVPVFLATAAIAVFTLSAAATGFGTVAPIHWQGLAGTVPYILLLSVTTNRAARLTAGIVWGATVIAIAIATVPASATGAAIIAIAGISALGFSGVWAMFLALLQRLADAAESARQASVATRVALANERVAQASYRRWMDAGLDDAAALLRDIRDGRRSPDDADTRASCDEEERYLRQLVQIPPALVHLGREIMPVLRQARALAVPLTLRLGDADAGDGAMASSIAAVIGENVAAAAEAAEGMAPGAAQAVAQPSSVAATLFAVSGGIHLTVTGTGLRTPAGYEHRAQHMVLGTIELLEVDFGAAAPVASAASAASAVPAVSSALAGAAGAARVDEHHLSKGRP